MPSSSRRHVEPRGAPSIPLDVLLGRLLEQPPLLAVLVGDARLERVVGVRLDEQLAHGLEHGGQLPGGLPVLGLELADADVAVAVVGDVGVVDARGEGHDGGLEGVVGREGDEQAELAAAVGRVGRALEGDVPLVEVRLVGEVDGYAGRGVGGAFVELLNGWGRGEWLASFVLVERRGMGGMEGEWRDGRAYEPLRCASETS